MTSSRRARERERRDSVALETEKFCAVGKRSEIWASEGLHPKESSKQADILWICFLTQDLSKNLHRVSEMPVVFFKNKQQNPANCLGSYNKRTVVIQPRIIQRQWDWRRLVQGNEVDTDSNLCVNPSESNPCPEGD